MFKIKIYFIFALLFLAGCSEKQQSTNTENNNQPQALPVNAIVIQPQKVSSNADIPGRVEAYAIAEIRPQVSGIVEELFFEQGSFVEEGQQLFQIEDASFQAELSRAQAALIERQALLQVVEAQEARVKKLLRTDAVSEQEYEDILAEKQQAQAAVDVAKANVETAQVNLDYTKVFAPLSGFIGSSSVTQGALVTAQQQVPLATIRQLDPIYVDLSLAKSKVQFDVIRQQMTSEKKRFEVHLVLDQDTTPYTQKGRLLATNLAIDEDTATIQLRAQFSNPNGRLLPGMFVRARIEDKQANAKILVPQKAVNIDNTGAKSVWVVDKNNKAQTLTIQTNNTFENNWVVSNGLSKGDVVIVDGTLKLQPGTEVKVNIANDDSTVKTGDKRPEAASNSLGES